MRVVVEEGHDGFEGAAGFILGWCGWGRGGLRSGIRGWVVVVASWTGRLRGWGHVGVTL